MRKVKKPKSLPTLKKELQLIFNSYIRKRDEGLPCIACGQFKPLQAGHFYSVRGYDGLRFNELNAHGECARCNLFDDMHLLNYAANLQERIGGEGCDTLKMQAEDYKQNGYKFTRTELTELIKYYKSQLK